MVTQIGDSFVSKFETNPDLLGCALFGNACSMPITATDAYAGPKLVDGGLSRTFEQDITCEAFIGKQMRLLEYHAINTSGFISLPLSFRLQEDVETKKSSMPRL